MTILCDQFCVYRAAVSVLGAMYEKLGRMMGSSFPETIQGLLKALKNAEVENKPFKLLFGICQIQLDLVAVQI